MAVLFATATSVVGVEAEAAEPAREHSGTISILDAEPQLLYGLMRYPKYYGDPNMDRATIDGSILDRQYLLGSLGGARNSLAQRGWIIDAAVTQAVQGVASGSGDGARYFGSGDLWIALDTGRAKLWSGGLIFAHAEGDWGETVSGTGALLPLNGDTIMPAAPASGALSELYLFQALPDGFALVIGKVDFAGFADTSPFANNERTQFLYEGLINNPILGSFVPYTSLGTLLLKQVNAELGVAVLVASNNTKATTAGFDDLSADTMTYGYAMSWTPKFGDRPGAYSLLAGYTSKAFTNFNVDRRYLIGEIIGVAPVAKEDGNYAMTLTGSQYLWVDPGARRSDGQPVGLGPFVRFGIVPKDRNLIDQFYSVGLGGNGGLFGRTNDNWGIGWAATHFSSDLRQDLEVLGAQVDNFEHAVEGFYNLALTPAVHLSLNAQYINSANPARNDAVVLSTRLQLDF